jgi:hypothetical protein
LAVAALALLPSVALLTSCGESKKAAEVRSCLNSPVPFLEAKHGSPRTNMHLELEVTCQPARPFELSEVETSQDSSVIGIEKGGTDTCVHRKFSSRGQKCALEIFFEPGIEKPGLYDTFFVFQYAHELEQYATRIGARITAQ